ncbi:Nucleotide exchange factor SIL1 [Hyphodiscus hymeniophilus]|uniref:Nucleotide exchange factor SIL1 n=1 Tax=Hyphodiscus hymeniophilus TaxID=353542 RepID=A0A9P6VH55_9HELO|nr:Nucleotide exchange factor SIL1 [Hyphodiscus hymeniophilus]
MANSTHPTQDPNYLDDSDFDDRDSLASIETDDGEDHPPEKILTEITSKNGFTWYLIQWKDCPVIRSSWEGKEAFDTYKWLLEDWDKEKENQARGESTPLDVAAFNKKVLEVELAERQRRVLRRLRRTTISALRCALLGLYCLTSPVMSSTETSSSSSADADLICSTIDSTDCYPRLFQPTKDFQPIKEGQDIPPGLHVRMNIYSGEREARLNIPMEGEEVGESIEIFPEQQAMVIVEQPEEDLAYKESTIRHQVPDGPPAYEKVVPPPDNGDGEIGTFQTAMIVLGVEGRGLDSALDDLNELSHDIYYGVEIAKNGPVIEKLVCLTLGQGTEKFPADKQNRDKKAASILASAIQNNPKALEEVSKFSGLVMYPNCGAQLQEAKTRGKGNFVSVLRGRLGKEKEPQTLKAKINTISGLLKEPLIRKSFLENGGMELLLAIWLKKGEQWDVVRRKVAQTVTDNFLDEDLGAKLGIFPKLPLAEATLCETKGRMLEDGCWEHHVEGFLKREPDAEWARDFSKALGEQRKIFAPSIQDREL